MINKRIFPGPNRVCSSTGPLCLEQCPPAGFSTHQWCGACDWFLMCQAGTTTFFQCPDGNVYDENLNDCRFASDTCHNCFYGKIMKI